MSIVVTETEANGIKDEFWARYPSLKMFLSKEMVKEFISEEYILEKGKLIGDNKAKELNEKCEVLFIKEIEHLINKYRFMADVLELLFLWELFDSDVHGLSLIFSFLFML